MAQIHIYDFVALGDQKKPPSKLKNHCLFRSGKRNKCVLKNIVEAEEVDGYSGYESYMTYTIFILFVVFILGQLWSIQFYTVLNWRNKFRSFEFDQFLMNVYRKWVHQMRKISNYLD